MGRSLAPLATVSGNGAITGSPASFDAGGFHYTIERRDGHTFHKESRLDSQGQVLAEVEAEVNYMLGSGTRGASYLIERDGYLVQSPISWYAQSEKWDLSPGYQRANTHFDRPVRSQCLSCHANRVDAVEDGSNRYRSPIFQGHAIGCERCHGPGELHARSPAERTDAGDMTIVNPRRLEPVLREDVCQQCHLQGDHRIERAGRNSFDYRPGLPLDEFIAVFFRREAGQSNKAVGQVEQMQASACYRASGMKLGCISCHDPHRVPTATERVAFYKSRCETCHADRGCSVPEATRRRETGEDDCIRCHMPRSASVDIAHTASTNHRIPRHADQAESFEPGYPATGSLDGVPLVLFDGNTQSDASSRTEAERDLGLALFAQARSAPNEQRVALARLAAPRLEDALKADADDTPARNAFAGALWLLGRRDEAFTEFETILQQAPNHAEALEAAANLAHTLGQREQMLGLLDRAIANNPWHATFYQLRAQIHMVRADWRRAMSDCRDALRLNPSLMNVRIALVECYLRLKDRKQAKAEFETLLKLGPSLPEAQLRSWFERPR
jgi:Tfp pilus assembly protein PilF